MGKLTFRGMELRGGSWKIEESGLVHRLNFLGDLSSTIAEALDCTDTFYNTDENGKALTLREIHADLSLSGGRPIESLKLEPNGMTQHSVEITATGLDYEIYSKRGKEEDDPSEVRIRVKITTGEKLDDIEAYARVVGQGKAAMKVTVAGDRQMKLEPEPEEQEAREAPLASRGEMKRKERQQ
jgi:hypothetical protein